MKKLLLFPDYDQIADCAGVLEEARLHSRHNADILQNAYNSEYPLVEEGAIAAGATTNKAWAATSKHKTWRTLLGDATGEKAFTRIASDAVARALKAEYSNKRPPVQ